MYCASALGALEQSFPYGTTPRNILDKAAEKPDAVAVVDWTFRRRFEAGWQALKDEFQPSISVDLKQIRDQISKNWTIKAPETSKHSNLNSISFACRNPSDWCERCYYG